ncbi:hypothetical protein J7L87_05995, partial [bacterium]|nr:hypothetical protein [bacterium]
MKKLLLIFILFSGLLCFGEEKNIFKFPIFYEKTFGNSGGLPGPCFNSTKKIFYGGSPDSEGIIAVYLSRGIFAFDEEEEKIYCNTMSDNFYEIDSRTGVVLNAKTLGPGWHYSSTGLACDENYLYSIHGNKIQKFSKETMEYKGDFIKLSSPRRILIYEGILYV